MTEAPIQLPPGQVWGRRWVIYAALGVPKVDPEKWRLRVDGLVERPLEFSYPDLTNSQVTRYKRSFFCVTKWSIENPEWEGVSLPSLVGPAGVSQDAKWVMFHCLDGYTAPIPVEDALDEDSIVALRINGKPLSTEQGFPARPFMPKLYGWKSAKWLSRIEFIRDYRDGYWEMYGYHERGNVWEEERFKGHSGKHSRRTSIGTAG